MDKLRSIDIKAWTKVGEGGNGSTYENPSQPDVLLKLNRPRRNGFDIVRHEFEVSKAVEGVGLSTPRMIEMVRVEDAFATISERIKEKRSLSRICHDEPQRTEEMARVLSQEGKKLFGTPCDTTLFPSRKEQVLDQIDKVSFLSRKNRRLIRAFAETISESDRCVHGDFQPGNIIRSDGRYYWIDLDRFAHGDPMFDIGHLFLICHQYASMKRVQDLFHMTQEQLHRFWDAFVKDFTGKDDCQEFEHLAGRFACLDIVLRCCFDAPSFAQNIFFGIICSGLVKAYFRE